MRVTLPYVDDGRARETTAVGPVPDPERELAWAKVRFEDALWRPPGPRRRRRALRWTPSSGV